MVAPGLAGFDTIMRLHDAEMIRHPNARWGITEGNPIHDGVRRIAALSGVDFGVDVAINRDRQITHVAAGALFAVHRELCGVVKQTAMQACSHPFDVVVTTNSGYPLDQNLYQTVKGMSAAVQVVKPGGVIVCASECSDGFPSHGGYVPILTERDSVDGLLEMINTPGHNRHDQWEVQVQAQIQQRAEVLLKDRWAVGRPGAVGASHTDRRCRRGDRRRLASVRPRGAALRATGGAADDPVSLGARGESRDTHPGGRLARSTWSGSTTTSATSTARSWT